MHSNREADLQACVQLRLWTTNVYSNVTARNGDKLIFSANCSEEVLSPVINNFAVTAVPASQTVQLANQTAATQWLAFHVANFTLPVEYTWSAEAVFTDAVGFSQTVQSVEIFFDSRPPNATVVAFAPSETPLHQGDAAKVRVTVNETLRQFGASLNGVSGDVIAVSALEFEVLWLVTGAYPDGVARLALTMTDMAGNTATHESSPGGVVGKLCCVLVAKAATAAWVLVASAHCSWMQRSYLCSLPATSRQRF